MFGLAEVDAHTGLVIDAVGYVAAFTGYTLGLAGHASTNGAVDTDRPRPARDEVGLDGHAKVDLSLVRQGLGSWNADGRLPAVVRFLLPKRSETA